MIRFVHTADVHFGMENYGRVESNTGIHSRLTDFSRAFEYCISHAIDNSVDFFLFCGDAYKTTNPSPTQQRLLLKSLLRLYAAKIPVVIIVGNHDHPLSAGKATTLDLFGELPIDGFHVISKPSIIELQTRGGTVSIVGIPWPTRNILSIHDTFTAQSAHDITSFISRTVTGLIKEYAARLDPSRPAILASHLTVSTGIFSGSEKRAVYGTDPLFLVSDLAIPPFDYVALGHLHRHQNLNPEGFPPVVYSGSIERIDFGERADTKGFCDVIIRTKGDCTFTFVPVPTRPFVQIEYTLEAQGDHTAQLLAHVRNYSCAGAIVKIVYQVPAGITDMVDLKKIQYELRDAWQVIGIIPIRQVVSREKRFLGAQHAADMETLLRDYCSSRADLCEKTDQLVDKMNELRQGLLDDQAGQE